MSGEVPPTLEAALAYARRGWLVFPVHTVRDGQCSCGHPACTSPGKHPRTEHGAKDATTDETIIRQWWTHWADANVGIATGGGSGLVVVDVDPRNGGDDSLDALERQHGELPQTVEALTGGGGRHIFFAHPGGRTKNGVLAHGVDIKADGGYVVGPPSVHASGGTYVWETCFHPDDVPLAEMPPWLLSLVCESSHGSHPAAPVGERISEGRRNQTLASLAGTMRRRGMDEDEIRTSLQVVNENRCVPPLSGEEVGRIAASVAQYPPARGNQLPQPQDAPPTRWPDPLAAEALYGLAGDIVRAIEAHSEADPAALLVQVLVAFGNVIGRNPHFVVEADRHTMNLYAVLVGETAKGRKGTSWSHVRRLFHAVAAEWADERVQSGASSGEGLIWAVRDPIEKQDPIKEKGRVVDYQTVITDTGIADKRLLVLEAEFASPLRVIEREGNTLSAIIRQAWDTGHLRVLTKNSPAKATAAHISIVGHITRNELIRYLSSTETGNGLANRFLWVCVRRSKVLPEGGRIDEVNFAPLIKKLGEAVQYAHTAGAMRRDEEARAIWHRVYPELSEGMPGLVGSVTSRAEAQVMRLSCVYALLDGSSVVRKEHLLAALALWEYCEASARYVFGDAVGDPVADELLRAVRDHPDGMTRTEIRDLFGRHQKATAIDRALALLSAQGLLSREIQETGGRSAERWFAVTAATKATQATKGSAEEGFGR